MLEECCESLVTSSSVILASDLYERGRTVVGHDPHWIVTQALQHLNELGLVTYRVGETSRSMGKEGGTWQMWEVPTQIRVTDVGYRTMGYVVEAVLARGIGGRYQHRSSDLAVRHPGDQTDFRTLDGATWGGPIEREPLDQHLLHYPSHLDLHADALRELRQQEDTMASLRETIMDGVFDAPQPITVHELFDAIKGSRPLTMSDVVKQTWNLQKTGELTFKERKHQSGTSTEHGGNDLVGIRLTSFGLRNVQKRRGLEVATPEHDRPFVTVTMNDVLEGTGMKPIEPPRPEREKIDVTERLMAYREPEPERVVAAQILAESVGGKVVEERPEPGRPREFGVRMSAPRSTSTDRGRHPVGRDMTDERNHGYRAKGGPVTRERVAPAPPQPQVPASEPQVPASEASEVVEPVSPSPMTDLETRFPLIWRIYTRETKAAQAAKLLEEAGLDDLALQTLEKVTFTDLEKEIIALVKELGD